MNVKKITALLFAAVFGCGAFSFAAGAYRSYDCTVDEYPAFSAAVENADGQYEVIVKTDGARPDFRALHPDYTVAGPDDTYVLCFDKAEAAEDAVSEAETMRGVMFAEPNGIVTAQGEVPMREYATYGVRQMEMQDFAEELMQRDTLESVTVAVVDSGIIADLPVFRGRLVEGKSFIPDPNADDSDPFAEESYLPYDTDEFGHGTGVASIVADCTQGLPVSILPVKVLRNNGNGTFLDTANGIRYAVDEGAQIINLSFVATSCSELLHDAVNYALDAGSLTVTAAGNYGLDMDKKDCCPAHLKQGITVSGCAENGTLYPKTCYGQAVDLCAPAVDVPCCTTNGSIGYADGTSFAAPHVAAEAAMLRLYMPDADINALTKLLIENAGDLDDEGFDVRTGWGVPDLSGLDGTKAASVTRKVADFAVQTPPAKTKYYYKEHLDKTGFVGLLTYSDGTKELIRDRFTYPRVTFSDVSTLRPGKHTLQMSYGSQSASFDVTVQLRWWQWIIWICLLGFLWY